MKAFFDMNKCIVMLLVGGGVGYGLACLCVSVESSIDVGSGRVRERFRLPPFEMDRIRSDRAFPLIFQSSRDAPEKWVSIGEERLVGLMFRKNEYTRGQALLADQRALLSVFSVAGLDSSERKSIADKYFDMVSDGDYAAASEYVRVIWESVDMDNK